MLPSFVASMPTPAYGRKRESAKVGQKSQGTPSADGDSWRPRQQRQSDGLGVSTDSSNSVNVFQTVLRKFAEGHGALTFDSNGQYWLWFRGSALDRLVLELDALAGFR